MKELSEKQKNGLNIFLTVLYVTYLIILLILSLILFIPYGLLRLFFFPNLAEKYMNLLSIVYAALFLYTAGTKIVVNGLNNLPEKGKKIVFVANHQSLGDIPVIRLAIPRKIGFISKVELFRVPIFQLWLIGMKCIPIDRKSIPKSHKAIKDGSVLVKQGFPMLIFPEGTRSSCNGMRDFKKGAMKLAEWAEADIVPVTIDGSYKFFTDKGIGFNTRIIVTLHEPVSTVGLDREQTVALSNNLWTIINNGLENPNTEKLPPKQK